MEELENNRKYFEAIDLVSDWIKTYKKTIRSFPVASLNAPGDLLNQLPKSPPQHSISFEHLFEDFKRLILPGITHWQHPKFFAYFPANASPPSILAEMLVAAMGVQGMSWVTSPAATELEIRTLEWLRDLIGLPKNYFGCIQDSASAGTMIALTCARERSLSGKFGNKRAKATQLVAYCSKEAHSSVEKGARIIGIEKEHLRYVETDKDGALLSEDLAKKITEDKKNGLVPFFIAATFGTTSRTAIDPLDQVAKLAEQEKLWFHIDAAYAGAALILPEYRDLAAGYKLADSFVFNPHKWLFTNFDCSAYFVKDRDLLLNTLGVSPEYLRTDVDGDIINLRDTSLGLGRRFRSLKLWFVMNWYGVIEMQSRLRHHLELTKKLQLLISADERFEILAPVTFNLICFTLKLGNQASEKLMKAANKSGKLYLSHTVINGRFSIRLVVGQTDVEEKDVLEAWTHLSQFADEICEN